ILRGLECAAESAHVLPVNEHARVLGQRARLRLANGFQISDAHVLFKRAHPRAPPPSATTIAHANPPDTDRAPARVAPWRWPPRPFGSPRPARLRSSPSRSSAAAAGGPRRFSNNRGPAESASTGDPRSRRHRV